ncbi:Alb1-domain-containing protein [Phaeosphaeriaceae sp. PMI808]|nr:Alb1-domain-containing protein [Phaeosphaeriaceae sp. PMI808]
MAKTAKVKKRPVTIHSRAARRASSPSLNLDKTLKTKPTRDSASPSRPSQAKHHTVLATNHNGGIQKKSSNKNNMTRAQRLRHQKGLERAADNLDKMQVRVVKSLGKEQVIKGRSKGWDDVNAEGVGRKKGRKSAGVVEGDEVENEGEWVDDEDIAGATEVGAALEPVVAQSSTVCVEEDELL